ncbi:SDR family NAD(P)-dependent oxidoreductase [Jiangella anatolica]|uniref:3-oxoacyl-ACP reductase n=1 Tax=Jiangella anatolica TaxID=2670374 RepID=A0A2W2BH43_9ACTN|nr:SDR family NAD(P)-dependent oxidoreductase [Jiangella anatolica]PZF85322.1 3-oxoacyl-ACP reductase [Jiangella anatolica]
MISFADQSAVVVGAGAGIGRSTAALLARLGAAVTCVDRDAAAAATVADEIAAAGGRALAATADVTDPAAVRAAFGAAADEFGPIHAAVNCAGVTGQTGAPSHEVSLDDFAHVHRVNVHGAMVVSQVAVGHMLPHGYGRIVHVASISGKDGNPNMVAYSSSKAALIGMVKVQGKEYAQHGITVNAIAPAVIRTDMVAALPDDVVAYMVSKIPMGRTGELDEAAAMIAFVASSACSFTTGFTFDLTGGRATY